MRTGFLFYRLPWRGQCSAEKNAGRARRVPQGKKETGTCVSPFRADRQSAVYSLSPTAFSAYIREAPELALPTTSLCFNDPRAGNVVVNTPTLLVKNGQSIHKAHQTANNWNLRNEPNNEIAKGE